MLLSEVRKRAEEKARNRKNISQRKEENEILRNELDLYNGENVFTFNAVPQGQLEPGRKLRVASYCRVSTDEAGQVVSIELQKKEYKKKILNTPEWTYYGTFVDDGFSGTNTEHRPGFQLMMEEAMAGKFDMIITKSVSRFARNLVDCIKWVRILQKHDPPIAVYFEDVNLNTLSQTSNVILFVLAMVAEEESHMKSEAMLISLEWRFSRGRFMIPRLLGYETVKDKNGKKTLAIVPEEKNTILLMYYMLLNGSSLENIAATLTDLGRPSGSGRIDWTPSMVRGYLRNERYCGDILARKTWTPDFHEHKAVKNRGMKNKYYHPNYHEKIVTRAQWNAAQKILNSSKFNRFSGYPPMRVVTKGALRGFISINRKWAGYEADDYFRACSIALGIEEGELDLEKEFLPDGGVRTPYSVTEEGIQKIKRQLSKAEKEMEAELEGLPEEEELPQASEGFQVADGRLFSHNNDPVLRIRKSSMCFSRACVEQMPGVEYIELLFNPLERMFAIRECAADYPNAISWKNAFPSTPFCKVLFEMLGWNPACRYQMLMSFREKNGEKIALFDLDNCIVKVPAGPKKGAAPAETDEPAIAPATTQVGEKIIFYGAEDEPKTEEKKQADQERQRRIEEIEQRTFGSPVYEHDGKMLFAPIDIDGEWDIAAEAVEMDSNYYVDDDTILNLQIEMSNEEAVT